MSQINKLYRNFIILQEDERGHSSTSDKSLSGYSKIESKGERCKVSFYAQNLRKESGDYNIMLICNKKDSKQLIDLGRMVVTDSGKGECTKEYFIDNIAGLDISFDKICGAAIVKMRDSSPIFIMCGFVNGDQPSDDWRNYKIVKALAEESKSSMAISKKLSEKNEEKERERQRERQRETERETEREKEREREIEKEREKKKIKSYEKDNQRDSHKDNQNKYTEIEEGIKFEKVDPRGKFDEYEESIEVASKESDEFTVRGSVGEYFEGIARGFENRKDKYKEIKNCKWYEVRVNDLYEMCNMSNYNKYTVAYFPMLNYYPYIKKYGKFMLGYKCDSERNLKYIVYGVPGKKDKDEQPYEGKTGFVTWISDDENNRDDMGCWLMFYDFKNSTVVVPMQ